MSHLTLTFRSLCISALLTSVALAGPDPSGPAVITNRNGVSFPTQAELGNIFVTGQKVRILANVTTGDHVAWTVSDYQGHTVDSGTTEVTAGAVTIEPKSTDLGYYLMTIDAQANGAAAGEGLTSYAVIPALDNSKMAAARFGVASHFGKNMTADLAPILAKAGIAHIRDSMDWGWIEQKPGVFDFTVHDFIGRMAALDKCHIIPLITAVFGNSLHYDDRRVPAFAAAPHTPDQYKAYTQLCLEHLKQFGTQIKALEIWNEYNGSFCRGAAEKDRPKYYTEMLADAYQGIKAVRPDVQVLGGAMVKIPMPYCEKLFKAGALKYMDGIVVHPYEGTPEFMEPEIRQFVDLMKKYNHGQAKPIWVTEFGTWQDQSVGRAHAASYLLKANTVMLAQPEVARTYWYLARDYDEFKTMGLVHSDVDPMGKYTPVISYPVFAVMARELFDAAPKGREAADSRTRVFRFDKAGETVWVCWSMVRTADLVFQAGSPLTKINMVGGEETLPLQDGKVTVQVGDEPVYIVAKGAASVTESPRSDKIIADSIAGFSSQQGGNGWSYAWYASNGDGSAPYNPDGLQMMKWLPSTGDWFDSWAGPGQWFKLSEVGAQPSAGNGGQYWAVRRWTSTFDGPVHVVGDVDHDDPHGDGIGCNIYLDGRQIFSRLIPAKGRENIDLNLTVKPGSKLDFAITPGPGTDANFDSSGFHASILTPSRP